MEIKFNEEEINKLENIKTKYPDPKSALMPALWMAQRKFGWLSDDVQQHIADLLDLPFSHVHGVATFYTMYFKKPMGRYHIQVCTNVSCMLREGKKIFDHISQKYGIGNMEVTPDGKFSLEDVECMGACGFGPMIAVNEDYYENLTIDKVDSILNNLE